MKCRYVLAVYLLVFSTFSWATPKLDLVVLQIYFETGKRVDAVAKKYPAFSDSSTEFLLGNDNKEFVQRMKSVGALEEINTEVKKSGFKSVDDYLDMTRRVMSALFAVQLQQSREYSSPESMRKMVAEQKKQLETNGIAPAKIAQMMAAVDEQLKQLDKIFAIAKKAQAEDVAAVQKNLDYVINMIDSGSANKLVPVH